MARTPEEERTLALVLEMYNHVLAPMNADAVDAYISPDYVQHSPLAAPGRDALKGFLRMIKAESPDATTEIRRAFVDGDHVVVHVHVVRFPGDPGLAVADIFRVEGDLIVEHWDVIQEIPTDSPNPNPML